MSHPFTPNALLLAVSASALCFACNSDPNRNANDPTGVPTAATPVDKSPAEPSPVKPSDAAMPAPQAEPTLPPQTKNDLPLTGSPTTATSPGNPPSKRAHEAAPLSEGQIAMVADLANGSEVEQGKLAQNKARSASVKKFAGMMVKHHTEAKQEQAKVFKKLNLTPTQSQQATALKADADKTLGALRAADAGSFDGAYMDAQVSEHQKVLETIDQQLLPAATSPDLVDGLKKMRATVVSHLDEAKTVQGQIAKSAMNDIAAAK
jgi:putative membrane protein